MNIFLLTLIAATCGITMKIADLLDEHGLKLFTGADIVFGMLWGLAASLLIVFGNAITGTIYIAMMIGFLIRHRLDYFNHQLAAAIVLVSGFVFLEFQPKLFFFFLAFILIGGPMRDRFGDINGFVGKILDFGWYYPLPSLLIGIYLQSWETFFVILTHMITYAVTKHVAARRGYK